MEQEPLQLPIAHDIVNTPLGRNTTSDDHNTLAAISQALWHQSQWI